MYLKYKLREVEGLHLLELKEREAQIGCSRHAGSSSQGNSTLLISIKFLFFNDLRVCHCILLIDVSINFET